MARIVILAFLVHFMVNIGIGAEEVPSSGILLHEGDNKVSLTLKNGWNRDIRNLTARPGSEELPDWLQFAGGDEPVTILAGESGEYL